MRRAVWVEIPLEEQHVARPVHVGHVAREVNNKVVAVHKVRQGTAVFLHFAGRPETMYRIMACSGQAQDVVQELICPVRLPQHEVARVYVAVVVAGDGQTPCPPSVVRTRFQVRKRALGQHKERVGILPPQVWCRQVRETVVERRDLGPQYVPIRAVADILVKEEHAIAVLPSVIPDVAQHRLGTR
eukprot:2924599-Prymnesium_polylepis.2